MANFLNYYNFFKILVMMQLKVDLCHYE